MVWHFLLLCFYLYWRNYINYIYSLVWFEILFGRISYNNFLQLNIVWIPLKINFHCTFIIHLEGPKCYLKIVNNFRNRYLYSSALSSNFPEGQISRTRWPLSAFMLNFSSSKTHQNILSLLSPDEPEKMWIRSITMTLEVRE